MLRWNATVLSLLFSLSCASGLTNAQDFFDRLVYRGDAIGTWLTFTTVAAREDWFDFKAEVDADKGLLSRLAPSCRRSLADDGIDVFG